MTASASSGELLRRYILLDRQCRELLGRYINEGDTEDPDAILVSEPPASEIDQLGTVCDERDAALREWLESVRRSQAEG